MTECNKSFNFKNCINGVTSDLLVNTLTYPLNTIKLKNQMGICKYKINQMGVLFKGYKYGVVSDIIHSSIFYSLYDSRLNGIHPITHTAISSMIATVTSHPFNLRKKMFQVNKKITISKFKDNFKGLKYSLSNIVPGSTINFVLRDHMKAILPKPLSPFAGGFSSFISIILTHPIDLLCNSVCTGTKIKNILSIHGLKERLLEKNISIATKMILFDYFSSSSN